MKLNVGKTKSVICNGLQVTHYALTIVGTVLKESDDLVKLGVKLDSKMTFEKHLCTVSRAWLGILAW